MADISIFHRKLTNLLHFPYMNTLFSLYKRKEWLIWILTPCRYQNYLTMETSSHLLDLVRPVRFCHLKRVSGFFIHLKAAAIYKYWWCADNRLVWSWSWSMYGDSLNPIWRCARGMIIQVFSISWFVFCISASNTAFAAHCRNCQLAAGKSVSIIHAVECDGPFKHNQLNKFSC